MKIILEKAGHCICGIAKSVEQALVILKEVSPEIALLDIFLKGALTGIDLAETLSKKNIPFIYLSANSNETTFEAAKATQPYGFLVKPFREREILAALDIASYRHQHTQQLMRRQEKWLSDVLLNIGTEITGIEQKVLLLAKAFKSSIYYDYIIFDTISNNNGPGDIYTFQRIRFDEYSSQHGWDFLKKINITLPELNYFRKLHCKNREIVICNGSEFSDTFVGNILYERLNQLYDINSSFTVPLISEAGVDMSVTFFSVKSNYFNREHADLLEPLRRLLSTVIEHSRNSKSTTRDITSSKIRTETEVLSQHCITGIIGNSSGLLHVLNQVNQVAAFDTTILVLGETGVGKEGIAKAIHHASTRKKGPFIKINCAAIPVSLVESELFGHEKGAFTVAFEKRIGRFEQAQHGTIFLDEIGEIPIEVQSKLLRVLQEKELEPIGGRTTIKIDVRIIVATNPNLYKEVAAGKFRIDLYYRINVFPITLPPLRDRKEDIPLLADYFLKQNATLSHNVPKQISEGAMLSLVNYSWPGNIRELEHLVERHVLITPSRVITKIELPDDIVLADFSVPAADQFKTIADVDKSHILEVLKKTNGRVSGKGGAAEILQIPATTLASKMKKLGISWKYVVE